MYKSHADIGRMLGEFHLENMMFRYSVFVPKLYNYCKSLGMKPGKIMPSRAFCSDESQGYPIILIAKHFGTFPFNHGRVGGVVSTDRHGPHAEHGKDVVLIQASHVGYDARTHVFGVYRRLCTEHNEVSSNCGKMDGVLRWYLQEYQFAGNNIFLQRQNDVCLITIDNLLLDSKRPEGLILRMDKLVSITNGEYHPLHANSTSKTFLASNDVAQYCTGSEPRMILGASLQPDMFYYKKEVRKDDEGGDTIENNLLPVMPWVVSAKAPLLEAAKANTQIEFDRAYRTIIKEKGYQGKNLVYVAGLHIDISPEEGQLFPLTKFVPWAAYVQLADGRRQTIEQRELFEILKAQSAENEDMVDLEGAIYTMEHVQEIKVI
jgi:hypothetical protein